MVGKPTRNMPATLLMGWAAGTFIMLNSAWREREDDDADDEPQGCEDHPVADELSEIDARNARYDHCPEGRRQIAHMIADAQGQHSALHRHADCHRRL